MDSGSGCVLDRPTAGGPCSCEHIPAGLRWVLGLPLPLNRVGVEGLSLLPGIGPMRAAGIVRDRAEHGPFETVGGLTRVRGIGPKTLERLRPYLFVSGEDPACTRWQASPEGRQERFSGQAGARKLLR